jgi:hypothetical protein
LTTSIKTLPKSFKMQCTRRTSLEIFCPSTSLPTTF